MFKSFSSDISHMEGSKECPALRDHYCFMYELKLGIDEARHCTTGGRSCIEYGRFVSEKDYEEHLKQLSVFKENYTNALKEAMKLIVENIEFVKDDCPPQSISLTVSTRKAAQKIVEFYRPSEASNPNAIAEEQDCLAAEIMTEGAPHIMDGHWEHKIIVDPFGAAQSILKKYRPDLKWQNPMQETRNEKYAEFYMRLEKKKEEKDDLDKELET